MRKHNCGFWTEYRPLSNVMVSPCHFYANCVTQRPVQPLQWLHYLLIKLLKFKNLRPPKKSSSSTSPGFTERQCYDCLVKMENLLAQSVQDVQAYKHVAIKASRRKFASPIKTATVSTSGPGCAGDVLRVGETMGWV